MVPLAGSGGVSGKGLSEVHSRGRKDGRTDGECSLSPRRAFGTNLEEDTSLEIGFTGRRNTPSRARVPRVGFRTGMITAGWHGHGQTVKFFFVAAFDGLEDKVERNASRPSRLRFRTSSQVPLPASSSLSLSLESNRIDHFPQHAIYTTDVRLIFSPLYDNCKLSCQGNAYAVRTCTPFPQQFYVHGIERGRAKGVEDDGSWRIVTDD